VTIAIKKTPLPVRLLTPHAEDNQAAGQKAPSELQTTEGVLLYRCWPDFRSDAAPRKWGFT
jgi:hypothetical protein